jgi:hypothetical protein
MLSQIGTILCVESDDAVLKNRCEVLSLAGYTSVSASVRLATTMLSNRKFDVIVTAGLNEHELNSIRTMADGAELIPIDKLTMGTVLLFLVDERLRQLRQRKV